MKGRLFAILFAALASGVKAQTTQTTIAGQFFNCHRQGTTCPPVGTCPSSSPFTTCDCAPGSTLIQGYHCVPDTQGQCADTNKDCGGSGRGTCRQNDVGVDTCFCDHKYTGPDCETMRAEVLCPDNTTMRVTITPHGEFVGKIYAENFLNRPACQLTETVSGSGEYTADLGLELDPTSPSYCGIQEVPLAAPDAGIRYTVNFIVQYSNISMLVLLYDMRLTASCSFSEEGNATASIAQVDANGLDDVEVDTLVFPVDFKIVTQIATEAQITNAAIGDNLYLAVTLLNNLGFSRFRVENCMADNGEDDSSPNFAELALVEFGCPPDIAAVISGDHISTTDSRGYSVVFVPFIAFLFAPGSLNLLGNVQFRCEVALCEDDVDPRCVAPVCGVNNFNDASSGQGRRRRREAREEMVIVRESLSVHFGNVSLEEQISGKNQKTKEVDTAECLASTELKTMLSVLGVFILLLLIVLAVVTFLFCRRSHHQKSADDGCSMGSSTQTLTIPRPRV